MEQDCGLVVPILVQIDQMHLASGGSVRQLHGEIHRCFNFFSIHAMDDVSDSQPCHLRFCQKRSALAI